MLTSEEIHPDAKGGGNARAAAMRIGAIRQAERAADGIVLRGDGRSLYVGFPFAGAVRLLPFAGVTPNLAATPGMADSGNGLPDPALREEPDRYVISAGGLTVAVDKAPFAVRVFAGGELLCEWLDLRWETGGKTAAAFAMDETSHFYGLGEKTGFLDKRGESYAMWNSDVYAPHVPDIDALYQSIPWVLHYRQGRPAYGVLLDNPGRTVFDMRGDGEGRYVLTADSGAMDLYVLAGPTLKDAVSRLSKLTGRMPLPPKWAIGYQQSRYSYMSQEEVLEVARTFREKRIPCDVLYLDIHYMDGYRVFTWDPERFPRPKEMIGELAAMGFRLVPIVDPGVKRDPTYPVYREGVEDGYFCRKLEGDLFIGPVWPGPSAFPDFTDDRAAAWWGDMHAFYAKHGIRGIWNDMNEPSVFVDAKTMDLDVVHRNNGDPKTHGEWHNLYGMLMSKATYEGMKQNLDGERPFVLTRAGYAGIQRYAAVWTGDNRSYWEHMAMSIPMVLNLGLSGVAFAGPDIGGFSHHASGEMLARWTQMGAFFPFCRNHSAIDTIRQEPWRFGERIEAICRDYIGLRYRLMPYLYALFREAADTGLPIVRPLLLEYPDDPVVSNLCDQFLCGPDLLVAPILRPGTEARAVYLPAGTWVDYWSGERLAGGRWIVAEAPLERMPLYARAGAIVPEQPVRQHAGDEPAETSGEPLAVTVYAGGGGTAGQFRLYEDDGLTYAYENGEYSLRAFTWTEDGDGAVFACRTRQDGWRGRRADLRLDVRHAERTPAAVTAEGGAVVEAWSHDAASCRLTIRLRGNGDYRITIAWEG